MVTSKCFFLVLFFSVVLSFGFLCSASDHQRRSEDPRRRYEDCQRRCQWETRGDKEQDRCEEQCQRQFRREQRERQEEEGRRHRHDTNPEDPQRRFKECQEWCQQQGQRQQPQCQQQCRREFDEQRQQQEERSHRPHDSNPEDPQRRFGECQQWCQQKGQRQQPQCQQQCRREFEEQRDQQEERSHRRHDSKPEDPQRRFEECQQRCQQEGQRQQPQCQLQCQREFQQQREQQEERDPQRRYEECQQRCQQQGQQQQQPQCQLQCLREFQQQREQTQRQLQECQQQCQQEEQRPERKQQCVRQCREKFEQQPNRKEEDEREEWRTQSPNPYYFPRRKFAEARFQEDNGNFWVLQKFSQKHHLLKGINEYRVALLEANPNTFVLPHHCDAEKIYIVTDGKGTITFVTHKNKESFNVVPGVVVRIPAGSTVYLVNQDNKKKLTIAVLHRPVNNPGQFEEFFPAGQEQPQSYYRPFSHEILEAVFNTRSEQLEKLFHGRQSEQGMFRKASQEQIKSLSQGATSPKEKEERFAFNLLAQKPKYSNQNGKFFEACPQEFELLQNVDASVVGFEINQGSIFVPHYNSKSTFVVLVTEGNGHVEMVCPHLSSQSSREEEEEEESRSGEYMKVRSQLSAGDVFVVPAGHPVTYVASHNQNLRALAFGLYHQNNTRIFIAGKNNMVRQMDHAAKEIAFGVPSKLVDDVFNSPQESYFVSRHGQKQRGSEESRDNPISSILDIARLF